MIICDEVLEDPVAYRDAVLARPFGDVTLGVETFRGIQLDEDLLFPTWIRWRFPHLTPTLSFFRQSPAGQIEPTYVHTDRDMGDWTALLYLNPQPAPGDGTTFWRHRTTGLIGSDAADDASLEDEQRAWQDLSQWEPAAQIEARFGRALLFPSELFHSRSIPENYGTGDDARLVQVVFGLGAL